MIIYRDLNEWRRARAALDGSLGFVPTMGALHAGHAALIEASVKDNDATAVSIYVNPTQFNNADDLDNYPSTLDEDLKLAERLGATHVWLPSYDDLYPDGYRYRVDETEFSQTLCGAHRPGHFTGVLTVVMKLLNIVRPDRAYFGEKDHQQLTLVRDMVSTFYMDVDIIGVPTVREADGLALSSRNARLTPEAREQAPEFSALLNSPKSDEEVTAELIRRGFDVDYVQTLNGRRYGAVIMDCGAHVVRLIDNVPAA